MWLLRPQWRGGASLWRGAEGALWEERWHHRDVAGPGEIEGERGRPGPWTALLPVSSLPATLLSVLAS